MTMRVAVADDEVDVFAHALGAERRLREARRHREEVRDASVLRDEDGAHLRIRDVHAGDREVDLVAFVRGEDGRTHGDRIPRIEREHLFTDVETAQLLRVWRVTLDSDDG